MPSIESFKFVDLVYITAQKDDNIQSNAIVRF